MSARMRDHLITRLNQLELRVSKVEARTGDPSQGLTRFVVISDSSGKPAYCVLAPSLAEARRLNAELHPADAHLEVREPQKGDNIPTLTFDLSLALDPARLIAKPTRKAAAGSPTR